MILKEEFSFFPRHILFNYLYRKIYQLQISREIDRQIFPYFATTARADRSTYYPIFSAHGDVSKIPAIERPAFSTSDAYQRSKFVGEEIPRDAMAQGVLASTILRLGAHELSESRFLKLLKPIAVGNAHMFGSSEMPTI